MPDIVVKNDFLLVRLKGTKNNGSPEKIKRKRKISFPMEKADILIIEISKGKPRRDYKISAGNTTACKPDTILGEPTSCDHTETINGETYYVGAKWKKIPKDKKGWTLTIKIPQNGVEHQDVPGPSNEDVSIGPPPE